MGNHFLNSSAVNYAALAIPAFFIFVGLEYLIAKRRRLNGVFNFESSVANISIGVGERLLNLLLTGSFYAVFYSLYEHYAWWQIPNTWWVWCLLILSTDLVWYWYHRLGHEVNFLWAAHIVHHQSEEFNYTVSARITTFQAIIRNIFWCILPLMGFHPSMVTITLIIHGTYSFFTHTQLVKKLGWLEHIFITPSHHRVHHASNELYLNKNYGDLFVFWDKLFGTFQAEVDHERIRYGLTHPIRSFSFMWQHLHYYLEMLEAVRLAPGFKNKLKIIFGNPELLDQNIRPSLEKVYLPHRDQSSLVSRYRQYITAQIVAVILASFTVSLCFQFLDPIDRIVTIVLIFITLINCGAILEQRTWMYYLEHFRLAIFCGYLSYRQEHPGWFFAAVAFSVFTFFSPSSLKKWYIATLYGEK